MSIIELSKDYQFFYNELKFVLSKFTISCIRNVSFLEEKLVNLKECVNGLLDCVIVL